MLLDEEPLYCNIDQISKRSNLPYKWTSKNVAFFKAFSILTCVMFCKGEGV